jgi:alpha-D-xyloside xylohydrolase
MKKNEFDNCSISRITNDGVCLAAKKIALILLILYSGTVCLGQEVRPYNSTSAGIVEKLFPGIWKITYGQPEKYLPTDFKEAPMEDALRQLPDNGGEQSFDLSSIRFKEMPKGVVAEYKLDPSELIYGFGLQVNTFQQRGMRRDIRCNSWTVGNVGFSHAPLPFYVSSAGYGLLVNTARYVTFYMGSQNKLAHSSQIADNHTYKPSAEVEIVVEGAKGMEIYVFDGPAMMQVIQRYNLFSGGGAIPPLWGLGVKYRAKTTFNDKEVMKFAQYFRDKHIPCDMFGLEPGWHSASYSCSYAWHPEKFPKPDSLLNSMHSMNYKLNLWEHAYVHPTSPIFEQITPYSGDYAVWKGAVPDFITKEAREIFASYHEKNFLKNGVSAFKLDECDAAFYHEAKGEWSFPDIASFPSGIDGVQYRQLFGLLYQKTIWDMFRRNNRRTLLEVRASHLFATPYGAVLYSDMYDHADYIRMVLNSGFSGLNWSPEIRQMTSEEDLIRRLQLTVMSPHTNVDCWFLNNPPWYQFDRDKNNRNEFLPNYSELEQKVKKLFELRMSLIPYLYAAFAEYHFTGKPPFRALVLDYPNDKEVRNIQNQYMMGDHLMCAPFIDGASIRNVYLPEGVWYDFNTKKKYEGGKIHSINMSLDEIPIFVKDATILPLAKSVEFITPDLIFKIDCQIYGNPKQPTILFEDDGETFDFEKGQYNLLELNWGNNKGKFVRIGKNKKKLYEITSWKKVTE